MIQKLLHLLSVKLLIIGLFCLIIQEDVYAQCLPNIGFELGNTNSWQCFTGSNLTGTPTITTPGQVAGRHTITPNGTGLTYMVPFNGTQDPYSLLPVACPYIGYGTKSVRLGNDNFGSEAEMMRTTFPVNGSNASLIYRYAAVMENPNHTTLDQPFLEFNVWDNGPVNAPYAAAVKVQCPSILFQTPSSSSSLPPGWFASITNQSINPVYCSRWIPVSVNLGALNGHLVTIEFITADCTLGGHFGYAYVDLNCGAFSVVTGYCPGSTAATLFGPPGFNTYIWDTAGTGSPFIASGSADSLLVMSPDSNVIYSLVVIPPGLNACADTLYDTIHVQPRPTALFNFQTTACAGGLINFFDSSQTHIAGSIIVQWHWDFGDPASGGNNTATAQNPTHVFYNPGTYTVSLIVESDISCVSDTTSLSITIIPPPPINLNAGPNVSICKYDSTQLQATANAAFGPYQYHWVPSTGLSNDSISNPKASPTVTTVYHLILTDPSGCNLTDSVKVTVLGVRPNFQINGDDTVCVGENDFLSITNLGLDPIPASATYTWTPNTHISSTSVSNPTVNPLVTTPYSLTINDNGCSSSQTFLVNVDDRNHMFASLDTVMCKGSSCNLMASMDGPAPSGGFSFSWNPSNDLSSSTGPQVTCFAMQTTTYTVTGITYGGCVLTKNIVVRIGEPYSLDLPDTIKPCMNQAEIIAFNSLSADIKQFWWAMDPTAGSLASCITCSTAVVAVNQPVMVYVNTANTIGCRAKDSVFVSPIECPELIIPSAFSPNGDGKNDYFFLLNRNFVSLDYFEVYNRWGELVYSTTDIHAKGWDGTFKGQLQDLGVYVFKAQVVDKGGQVKTKTGNVTLIK